MTPRRQRARRIGILGGTFDPIHLAHLRVAEEAREILGLEQILFVPAAQPPHKRRQTISSAEHRLAMVRLAVAGHPAFRASTLETERSGRSYSIDTLRALHEQLPATTHISLLVGFDQFREIGTWKEFRALFQLADVAVMSRPPLRVANPRALLPVAARPDFCYGPDRKTLVHSSGNRILFLDVTSIDISASAIRRHVRSGQSIRYLVTSTVERYVRQHGLYAPGSKRS